MSLSRWVIERSHWECTLCLLLNAFSFSFKQSYLSGGWGVRQIFFDPSGCILWLHASVCCPSTRKQLLLNFSIIHPQNLWCRSQNTWHCLKVYFLCVLITFLFLKNTNFQIGKKKKKTRTLNLFSFSYFSFSNHSVLKLGIIVP